MAGDTLVKFGGRRFAASLRQYPGSDASRANVDASTLAAGCNYTTSVVWFGMPRGNPAVKLAVTVDADVHSKVLDAAEAEGKSVSAWITDAARRALLIRDGLAAVAEWEAEHGALTPAELLAARARIEPKASRRKRSPR